MNEKRKFLHISLVLVGFLILLSFLGGEASDRAVEEVADTSTDVASTTELPEIKQLGELREFSSEEFKVAFDNLSHPNMVPIVSSPVITGDTAVDEYIRNLAEQRGYQLRQVASGILNTFNGVEIQELLIADWEELKGAAKAEGVSINLVSGYRSIEEQSTLFNNRLNQLGLASSDITSGAADSQLDGLLSITAPPGYSRHHSGYTIDVEDPAYGIFEGSTAHSWISKDNYRNAKLFGFIPSYPEGLSNQGPNPEAWEYVWVSKAITHTQQ